MIPVNTNPLATKHYQWIHLHIKTSKSDCIFMSISVKINTNIPFMSLSDNDILNTCVSDIVHDNTTALNNVLSTDKTDYTIFADPDVHYPPDSTSNYYTET